MTLSDTASKAIARHQAREAVVRASGKALEQIISDNPARASELAQSLLNLAYGDEPLNLADVLSKAEDARSSAISDLKTLDDGWRNRFLREAAQADDESIREMFAQILVSEEDRAGTTSILTMRQLSTISRQTARNFERLCNLSLNNGQRAVVILSITRLVDRNDENDWQQGRALRANRVSEENKIGRSLEPYGLRHEDLLDLMNRGLLNSAVEGAEYPDFTEVFCSDSIEFAGAKMSVNVHGRQTGEIVPDGDAMNVLSFSSTGFELRRHISLSPYPLFQERLIRVLHNGGIELAEVRQAGTD